MDELKRALEDVDRTPYELIRDFQILRAAFPQPQKSEEDSRRAAPLSDSFPRVIFFDGVDGAGKTTRIKKLLKLDFPFKYFRSSYQFPSKFANRPVDLEESIHHDWRILYDFIRQTSDKKAIYLIDRGFLSSHVYSRALRNSDIYRYVHEYLNMFCHFSEFWLFLRDDSVNMTVPEQKINEEFQDTLDHLRRKRKVKIREFRKTRENEYITKSFLDYPEQILSWGLDRDYYISRIDALNLKPNNRVVISDLDGTILHSGYPQRDIREPLIGTVTHIKSKNPGVILIITGRPDLDSHLKETVRKQFDGIRVEFICNSRNIGMSSRILKRFIVREIFYKKAIPFIFLDDRLDVMKFVFSDLTYSKLTFGAIWEYESIPTSRIE